MTAGGDISWRVSSCLFMGFLPGLFLNHDFFRSGPLAVVVPLDTGSRLHRQGATVSGERRFL